MQRVTLPRLVDVLCPGLQAYNDKRILSYLLRTSASGGGAKPRPVICRALFGEDILLGDLMKKQMGQLLQVEHAGFLWENVHSTLSVYSTFCHKTIAVSETEAMKSRHHCISCMELLSSKGFKNAISRPTPHPNQAKFTPHTMTTPVLQDIAKRQLGVHEILKSVRFDISEGKTHTKHLLV